MTSLEQRTTRYLDWIDAEIEYVRTYHDQKERSAWTATAFYIPAIIVLGHTAGEALVQHRDLKIFVGLVLIGALSSTLMFVAMQFNRRWTTADAGAALRRLRAELIAEPKTLQRSGAEALPDPTAEIPAWPAFVRERILEYRTPRTARDVCAAAVRGLLFMWGEVQWPPLHSMRPVEMRTRSEAASYAIIVLSTIVAIGALFAA